MNMPGLSTNGLLAMYGAVRDALNVDDNTPTGREKPHGVREAVDWRKWADEIDGVLTERQVKYDKIKW